MTVWQQKEIRHLWQAALDSFDIAKRVDLPEATVEQEIYNFIMARKHAERFPQAHRTSS